jgi:hypothetical protein
MKLRDDSLAFGLPISVLVIALVSAWAVPRDFEIQLGSLLGMGGKPSILRFSAEIPAWRSAPQADGQQAVARCGAGPQQPLAFPRSTNWASFKLAYYFNSSSDQKVALVYQQQLAGLLRRSGLEWLTGQVRANFCKTCAAKPGAQASTQALVRTASPTLPRLAFKI